MNKYNPEAKAKAMSTFKELLEKEGTTKVDAAKEVDVPLSTMDNWIHIEETGYSYRDANKHKKVDKQVVKKKAVRKKQQKQKEEHEGIELLTALKDISVEGRSDQIVKLEGFLVKLNDSIKRVEEDLAELKKGLILEEMEERHAKEKAELLK